MSENSSGAALVIAALIVALSVLGAGYMLSSSVERGYEEMGAQLGAEMGDAVAAAIKALPAAAPARAAAQQPSRGGRPDPNRRYDITVGESPAKGPEQAKVTIVEWSDFQCPFCSRVTPTLDQINKEYGDQVRIVFKHLPLGIHPKAPAAHAAAEAAHQQGKFWEMHDLIFANQRELSPEKYELYAQQIGLDVDQYKKDFASAEVKKNVDQDAQVAAGLGVTGTPSFFINGRYLSGARPFASFKTVIDEELKQN